MLDKFERDTDPNKGEVRPPPPPGPENGSDLSQNSNEELLDPNYSMDEQFDIKMNMRDEREPLDDEFQSVESEGVHSNESEGQVA